VIFHAAITVFSAPPTREPDEHATLEILPLRRATPHRSTLSLSAGTGGDSCGEPLFQRAYRTNRSWDGPSSNWSRNRSQPGPQTH
jgi:hypothetical protein